MNPYARPETREDFKELAADIATEFGSVTGINEQDDMRLQGRKEVQTDIFETLLDQSDVRPGLGEPRLWIRLNADQFSASTFGTIAPEDFVCDARRVTRLNLNDACGLQIPNQRAIQGRIETGKVVVMEVEPSGSETAAAHSASPSIQAPYAAGAQPVPQVEIDGGRLSLTFSSCFVDFTKIGQPLIVVDWPNGCEVGIRP
jgi:hypothetical protein